MKLVDLLYVLDTSETVIIRRADDILFCGKHPTALSVLNEQFVRTATVERVLVGFGGLVIETDIL